MSKREDKEVHYMQVESEVDHVEFKATKIIPRMISYGFYSLNIDKDNIKWVITDFDDSLEGNPIVTK